MSILRTFEVSFTVYYDDAKTQTDSNLSFLTTRSAAPMPQQAQAMIEAQYAGRVQIYSVVQV
jgi:hypothetical protein